MRDIKINDYGDVQIEDGEASLTTGISDTAKQSLQIGLRLFYGEWELDSTKGIPYFQSILGQKTNISHASNLIRSAIFTEKLIRSVTSFDTFLDSSTRELRIRFSAISIADDEIIDDIKITI